MIQHWPWAQPTVLVLGSPGTPDSPARQPCLACRRATPISGKGLTTYLQLRRQGEVVLCVCYPCHTRMDLDAVLGSFQRIPASQLREYKGLTPELPTGLIP